MCYDAANIAIKTLIDAGASYKGMKHHLTHHHFKCIVSKKIGFDDVSSRPYLIDKAIEGLFEIRYIDEKGTYSTI